MRRRGATACGGGLRRLDGVDGGPEGGVVLVGKRGRGAGVGDLDGFVEEGLGVGDELLEGRRACRCSVRAPKSRAKRKRRSRYARPT